MDDARPDPRSISLSTPWPVLPPHVASYRAGLAYVPLTPSPSTPAIWPSSHPSATTHTYPTAQPSAQLDHPSPFMRLSHPPSQPMPYASILQVAGAADLTEDYAPAPPLRGKRRPVPGRPPAFANTYAHLSDLRLPFVKCEATSVYTCGYSDLHPATDPPRFMYFDPGLLCEVEGRFEAAIKKMRVANHPCSITAAGQWTTLCDGMQKKSYTSEDWVSGVGMDLLRLAITLVVDALATNPNWDAGEVIWDISQPPRENSQQGNKFACIIYDVVISALALEWKTTTVFDHQARTLGVTTVLPGGHLGDGRGIAKKIGLQQASISRLKDVDCRYGVIFTGTRMLLTSRAATSVNGQQVPGVRISSPLDLFSQENTASVSAVALLFALLTPPEITPYPDLPDPRSIPGTWSVLQPLLSVAAPTFFQSSRDGHHGGPSGGGNFGDGDGGQSRGGAGWGGGGHGRGPSSSGSSRDGGAGHSGYYAQNNLPSNGSNTYGRFSSMTMRHCGAPSVFNPTRRLVEITSEQLLAPQEARTESPAPVSDDSATDTASLSTAPTSPEVGDICLPHVHAHKPAHLDILHTVRWGASAMVLGASLIVADEIPFPVVLKIVKQPNFQLVANELAAYRQLARLCIVVPKLIALMAPAHERGWVAMVIEDAGKSFGCGGQSWDQIFLTASERIGIYLALVQIHAEGVLHGDPEPRNVVRRQGGTPCFVDFGLATVGHQCDRGTCEELMYLRSALELENR